MTCKEIKLENSDGSGLKANLDGSLCLQPLEEDVIFIASAKGRYGHKRTPTPLYNTHEKRKST